MADATESIIIIKKKSGGHGHHGGAWKVAYADFVTAMMSLFMVMWLMASSEQVKKSVAAYFQDPKGTSKLMGSGNQGAGHTLPLHKEDLHDLKKNLQEAIKRLPNFDKLGKQIEITAAPDGLQIELLEDDKGAFFEVGSAVPKPALNEFLTIVAKELGKMPNKISIGGHTDSLPYGPDASYTNWELSSDRANAARRLVQANGVSTAQVTEVRGFADQQLRTPDKPEDASNRRITILVHSDDAPPAQAPAEASAEGGEGKGEGEAKGEGGEGKGKAGEKEVAKAEAPAAPAAKGEAPAAEHK